MLSTHENEYKKAQGEEMRFLHLHQHFVLKSKIPTAKIPIGTN